MRFASSNRYIAENAAAHALNARMYLKRAGDVDEAGGQAMTAVLKAGSAIKCDNPAHQPKTPLRPQSMINDAGDQRRVLRL